MTRLNMCIVLLFVFIIVSEAQNAPTAQQLLDTAHKLADLSSLGPYKLTASFVVTPLDKKGRPNTKKQQTGTITVFRDHDRARFEAQLGVDHEIQFQIGNIRYVDPNGALFSLFGLKNFDKSWDPERPGDGLLHPQFAFSEPLRKQINDAEALCLEKRRDKQKEEEPCFAVKDSALVRAKQYTFSDYHKAGAIQFPRQVEIERPEMPAVKVIDVSVTAQAVAPDTFQVPERMLAIESCEDWRMAKPVFTPEPDLTDVARKHQTGGRVEVNLIIGTDGKVISAQALTEDRYGLAQESTNKVRTWKFEPATCGRHPVNAEMKVEFAFNLY